jgi:hypothetical protein
MKLMIIFTFLYIVAFILVIIYVSFLMNDVGNVFCSFSLIPYRLINGYNASTVKFLGLLALNSTLS